VRCITPLYASPLITVAPSAAQAEAALGGIDEAQVLVDQGIAGALAQSAPM
jgi:hypothetical protein